MPRFRPALAALVVGAALASAGAARAAVVPFTGTLEIRFGELPGLRVPGGGVATVNLSGHGHPIERLSLPAGAFGTSLVTRPGLNVFPIVQLGLEVGNGPIVLAGYGCTAFLPHVRCPGGGLNGAGALSGAFRLGLFPTTMHTAASAATTGGNPAVNMTVPLSVVGIGGRVLDDGRTISGAGWSTGTVSAYSALAPRRNVFHNPGIPLPRYASEPIATSGTGDSVPSTGSFLTEGNSRFATERITLVSPVSVSVTGLPSTPLFVRITLHFVPEPTTIVLLGGGVAGLLALGRQRRSRARPQSRAPRAGGLARR